MVGEPLPAAELDALVARYTAAGDIDARVSLMGSDGSLGVPGWPPGPGRRPDTRERDKLLPAPAVSEVPF